MAGPDRGGSGPSGRGTEFRTERGSDEAAATAILRSLAAIRGVRASEIEFLYDSVEVDALEQLLCHADRNDSYVGIEFTVGDHTVLVRSDDSVVVRDGRPRTARP